METKNIIFELRTRKGLSQDELAEKVMVTRAGTHLYEGYASAIGLLETI